MDDLMIIELYFARDEQAIEETDTKYGKLCFHMANNFLSNDADAEECVNDTYLSTWNTMQTKVKIKSPKRPVWNNWNPWK